VRSGPSRVTALPPEAHSAREAGLRYGTDRSPGIRRRKVGRGFAFFGPDGRPVGPPARDRIQRLAIPPAWTDVWIAPDPLLHLQATGRDARGRKQYRYHTKWAAVRNQQKYDHLLPFADALAAIRRQVSADLRKPPLTREWVLATVVRLLDRTVLRIGNEEYARANGSYGLTTLRNRHVRVAGGRLSFRFRAKSGVVQDFDVHDPDLARAVRRCQELPGQLLFQYLDHRGKPRTIGSADVNDYVRAIAGSGVSAKEFRTWAATLAAAQGLARLRNAPTNAARQREIVRVVDSVAKQLGNTRAVCRSCYIHPAILQAYQNGHPLQMPASAKPVRTGLNPCERALRSFLRAERLIERRAA
jgi:DNA topoisomerase-1